MGAKFKADKLPGCLQLRKDGKVLVRLRPKEPRYRALLSIDGGGVRGIIPAIVLGGFEQTVKTVARENFKEIENARDEELVVDMNDYFDMITGNSAGSILALFLSSGGGLSKLYEKGSLLEGFEPGSSAAAVTMVNDLAMNVFKKNLISRFPALSDFLALFNSIYDGNGLAQALYTVFGDLRMSDLVNNALVPAYELTNARPVAFHRQSIGGTSSTGYIVPEEPSNASFQSGKLSQSTGNCRKVPPSFEDLELDVPLRISAQASSSAPIYFDPMTYSSPGLGQALGLKKDTVAWADGGLVSNDPTMVALAVMGAIYSDTPNELLGLEKMAVMSLGTGSRRSELEIGSGKGLASWGTELITVLTEANTWQNEKILRGVLEGRLFGNVKPSNESYIRIDKIVYPDQKYYDALENFDDARKLGDLEQAGQSLIDDPVNQTKMKSFLKNILMQ